MQDYTPLGSTATTTVKDGMLNHEKNINALRSTYSGTAFPTENLVAGMKCYRTDLGKTYTYNGKAWTDSVSTSSLTVSRETSVPTPATTNKSKTIANTEFVHGVVSDLVNGAPTALDTLQELASALGNDPNFSTTILNKIGEKESKTDAQIEYKKLQDSIDAKQNLLTFDTTPKYGSENPVTSDGIKKAIEAVEVGAPDLTPYMKKTADSDLYMGNHLIGIADSTIDGSTGNFMVQTSGGVEIYTGGNNRYLNINGEIAATRNYVDSAISSSNITVDDALSATSTNPVQNKVIKNELDGKFSNRGGFIAGHMRFASPSGDVGDNPTIGADNAKWPLHFVGITYFDNTIQADTITVTSTLNVPGGKIWIA